MTPSRSIRYDHAVRLRFAAQNATSNGVAENVPEAQNPRRPSQPKGRQPMPEVLAAEKRAKTKAKQPAPDAKRVPATAPKQQTRRLKPVAMVALAPSTSAGDAEVTSAEVCRNFQRGKCRLGDECPRRHAAVSSDSKPEATAAPRGRSTKAAATKDSELEDLSYEEMEAMLRSSSVRVVSQPPREQRQQKTQRKLLF